MSIKSDKGELKERLKNPNFSQWLKLNHCPSSWVHKSWINIFLPGIHGELLDCSSTQRFLKEKLELKPFDWHLFSDPLVRLLLVRTESLERILSVLGALCYHVQLKTIIEKRFRQQLFEYLSPELLNYIERTGPLLLSRRPALLNAIRDKQTLWDSNQRQLANLKKTGEFILCRAVEYSVYKGLKRKNNDGFECWAHCLSLKLPYEISIQTNSPLSVDELSEPADQHVVTLIMKLFRHLDKDNERLII